jgi:hypothetical protein
VLYPTPHLLLVGAVRLPEVPFQHALFDFDKFLREQEDKTNHYALHAYNRKLRMDRFHYDAVSLPRGFKEVEHSLAVRLVEIRPQQESHDVQPVLL